jgi:hypothetical protein
MPIPHHIDFTTPSDEAVCLHEAGHACVAVIVGLAPALLEFIDDPNSIGKARSSIPVGDQQQRRLIACAAYAVEYNLFCAGRLVDSFSKQIDQSTFAQIAVGQNAALDKIKFFGGDLSYGTGSWPVAHDLTFIENGQTLASTLPMEFVFAIGEALLAKKRLDCAEILHISRKFLPGI